jgi:TrmH family RNA methyltransferase
MGSIFHLPVFKTPLPGYLSALRANGTLIACARLDGTAVFSLDWRITCLVIGNESRGVSAEVTALATDIIRIPMFGKAESLNAAVAAGILIYKIRT